MQTHIKHLQPSDGHLFTQLICLFEEVFEMEQFILPETVHLQQVLGRPDFIAFAVLREGTVIAGLTAHVLPSYYTASAEVYLYDLAVQPVHQRKGLGRALLNSLEDYCRTKGYPSFFVQADQADTHALDFYRSTGGVSSEVVQYTYFIK